MGNQTLVANPPTECDITITPLTGSIGARVDGVDVRTLSEAQFAAVRAAFLAHNMLVFRQQELGIEAHIAFAKRWGEIVVTPMATYLEG